MFRNGRLTEEPVVTKSSGDPDIDKSAIQAIKMSAPFPPFPKEIQPWELKFTHEFVLKP